MAVGEIPVTVLSGFLGSGKTTLLRALLSSGHVAPSSVGLIINDLAEVNVDARLVNAGLNGAETATVSAASEEMHGACACCSGREDLKDSLHRLAKRTPPLCHIILECSGMSDPRNIVQALLLPQAPAQGSTSPDQEHPDTTSRHPVLSSVVTVLDSSALAAWISSGESFQEAAQELNCHAAQQNISQLLMSQIECASLVVLHKVDRVSVVQLSACVQLVRTLNPLATLHCVKFGVLDPSEILQPKVSYPRMLAAWLERMGLGVTSTPPQSSSAEAPSTEAPSVNAAPLSAPSAEAPPLGSMGQAPAAAVEAPETEACCGYASSEGSQQRHAHSHACQEQTNIASRANKGSMPGSVRSFVFRSRRPFHPDRLQLLIRQIRKEMAQLDGHAVGVTWQGARGAAAGAGAAGAGGVGEASARAEGSGVGFMRGVLRSKGLVWVAPHMDLSREWSQTRGVFELQRGQPWEDTPPPGIDKGSNPGKAKTDGLVFGARRQEVVFIGTDTMDESRIRADLGACLLDDGEFSLDPEGWHKCFRDKIALTLTVAARTEASRQPQAHGSLCPCCDPQLRDLLGNASNAM